MYYNNILVISILLYYVEIKYDLESTDIIDTSRGTYSSQYTIYVFLTKIKIELA